MSALPKGKMSHRFMDCTWFTAEKSDFHLKSKGGSQMQRPVGWSTDAQRKLHLGNASLMPKGEQSKLSGCTQSSQGVNVAWLFPLTTAQIKTVLRLLPFPSRPTTQHDLSIDNFPSVPTEHYSKKWLVNTFKRSPEPCKCIWCGYLSYFAITGEQAVLQLWLFDHCTGYHGV